MWENWDVKFGVFNPTLQQRQVLPPVAYWYADSAHEQQCLETEFTNLPSTKELTKTTFKNLPHIYEFCYIGNQSEWPSMRGWKPPVTQPLVSEPPLLSPDSYLTAPESLGESVAFSSIARFHRSASDSDTACRFHPSVSEDSSDDDTSD